MDQHVSYILPLIFSLAFAQQVPPEIEYLRGVPRLNNDSFIDYYFTCSTVGETLQWRVKDVVFGFIGRETTGTTGTTITRTASNFQYITTLLSSQSSQAGLFTFDSVLIVSTTTSINVVIVVTCYNGVEFKTVTINDAATAQNEILNATSQNVSLQYLFSATIVNDSTTYFYLCGVNDEFQQWQTNSLPYIFSITDAIGRNRTVLSADQTVAAQQAILMAREPYSIISILLLTSIPDVNVTCASSRFRGTLLFSDVQSTTVTTPPPTTEVFTTNDFSNSIGTIKNTEQASDIVAIIASVLGVIIFLFIVVLLALIIFGIPCCRTHAKSQVKIELQQLDEALVKSKVKIELPPLDGQTSTHIPYHQIREDSEDDEEGNIHKSYKRQRRNAITDQDIAELIDGFKKKWSDLLESAEISNEKRAEVDGFISMVSDYQNSNKKNSPLT